LKVQLFVEQRNYGDQGLTIEISVAIASKVVFAGGCGQWAFYHAKPYVLGFFTVQSWYNLKNKASVGKSE